MDSILNITGTVTSIANRKGVSNAGKEWHSRTFIVETEDGFNEKKNYVFELFGDAVEQYPFRTGQNVSVNFEISCRQWQDKWFTSLRAISVNVVGKDGKVKKKEDKNDGGDLPF